MESMNRKGLSDVVTTVLIILLVLAAIVIIWSFVGPALRGQGQNIQIQTVCMNVQVEPKSCTVTTGASGSASVIVQYTSGDLPADVTLTSANAFVVDSTTKGSVTGTASPFVKFGTATATIAGAYTAGHNFTGHAGAILKYNGQNYNCPESSTVVTCS